MYVSLNGSLTRQMPWPDFVRLAGKLGYGGVDVNLNAAKADRRRRHARALQGDASVKPAVANLPLPVRDARRGGISGRAEAASRERAVRVARSGCTRMMAVLSPASPVPKDERRKFVKDRVAAICRGPAALEDPARPRVPRPRLLSLEREVAAHVHLHAARDRRARRGVRPEHRRRARRVALAPFRRHDGGDRRRRQVAHRPRARLRRQARAARRGARQPAPHAGRRRDRPRSGFFQSLKKIGYVDGVSPEPLGRVPAEMPAEEGARLGLESTTWR